VTVKHVDGPKTLAKWSRQLKEIGPDVLQLHWDRKIHRVTHEVVKAHPRGAEYNPLWDWMFRNSNRLALIMVRRLMDTHRDTVSLSRLASDICDAPHVITREWRSTLFSAAGRESGLADRCFDQLAGPGQDILDPETLRRHLDVAKECCKGIVEAVDEVLVHHDPNPTADNPTYGHLNDAIDAIGELYRFLRYVLCGDAEGDLEPTEQYDWDWVFREPWISPACTDDEE
jgi:hypothetical protein